MKKYMLLPLIAVSFISGYADDAKPTISVTESNETLISKEDVSQNDVEQLLQKSREYVSKIAHNDSFVMQKFDLFSGVLHRAFYKEKSMTSDEIQKICEGVDFAAEKHRFQTRKNKEQTPYISHPIGVAYNVMEIGSVRDTAVIIGALLHDTVEDTQTTYEEITERFGAVVAGYVQEVTDDKSLSQEERKRAQVINAAHKSKGAAQIKLADKLYNVSDLLNNPPSSWSQSRIDRYFQWAQSVMDRLPDSNSHLKSAVEGVINHYWETQEKKESS